MKKLGNLIEINGVVYRKYNKEEVKPQNWDTVLFEEAPQEAITPGKLYDIEYFEYPDPEEGDIVAEIIDDGGDDYDVSQDEFFCVSGASITDPEVIRFMISNRKEQIGALKWRAERFATYPEVTDLMMSSLEEQIKALQKRLERTKWLKEGAYARTTAPHNNDTKKVLPAGSLVKIRWKLYASAALEWICLSLEDGEPFTVGDEHLEPVGAEADESIDHYRRWSALKLAEKINSNNSGVVDSVILDTETPDGESTLCVSTDPFYGDYCEANKEGMISFLTTVKQHVTCDRVRKNIDKVVEEIQALQDHTEEDVVRTN
ncbi:hypothetical protein ERIC1_2c00090 [Paenibacillus larvae subsp. larvae DSM 25719]|uniref:hypothetical protein n=1 Tax=Paenibacillus larvae TaxID=1464 RepID=UPI0003DC6FFB|nr:hypothetical protein [Paenibacillus larvae]ETK25821.1 hypothetical protein ERIC1_2c00090 [Paenibacillus larvae subsp. larvae DSM 25719]